MSRRQFLKMTAYSGAGLCIGITLGGCSDEHQAAEKGDFQANAYLRITPTGEVIITVAESEMGQGVLTSLSMLVAEELDADWARVRVESAPADMQLYGKQSTGGSSSVREAWLPMRQAGAAVRMMLLEAAAQKWSVDSASCRAQQGWVYHESSNRSARYVDLVAAAAQQPIPKHVVLKEPQQFRLIGHSTPNLDALEKIQGRAQYGMDIRLPGMVYATISHCPVFGGKLTRFNAERARQISGVQRVLSIDQSVVVVASNSWAALQGQRALQIEWESSDLDRVSSEMIHQQLQRDLDREQFVARADGEARKVIRQSQQAISAEYALPFQAHLTMEPQCCVAHVREMGCEVWAPTQSPSYAKAVAAREGLSKINLLWGKLKRRIDGSDNAAVTLHVPFLGTGFGRRLQVDYVAEAVKISSAIGKPVNLFWNRQEDIQHDFYRPAALNRLQAVLGQDGLPYAWHHHIAGPSIGDFEDPGHYGANKLDNKVVDGAKQLPYSIPNIEVSAVLSRTPVPLGAWRSVGHSLNGFVVESFIDELAHAAGQDPVDYRRQLLQQSPRRLGVLELVAEKAGWNQPLPEGVYRGVALHKSFRSYVAQIAELSIDAQGMIKLHRLICAVDCGLVVNPDGIQAQMEGAVAFALTATLKGAITIERGRVRQQNFNDYPALRMSEMPQVETHIVPSTEALSGIGEPGVPPVAAAVANALFAATGKRIRKLPIQPHDLQ